MQVDGGTAVMDPLPLPMLLRLRRAFGLSHPALEVLSTDDYMG